MGALFENFEWLLLILPALSALVNGLLGGRLPHRGRRLVAYAGVVGAMLTALPLLVGESMAPGLVGHPSSLPWIKVWDGDRFIEGALTIRIDALSIFMVLVVLTVAFFLLRYFGGRRWTLAWNGCYLTALLMLVLSDNLLMLLAGWSLVGWLPVIVSRGRARHWTLALLGDLSLLMGAGLTARHIGSLSLGRLAAMWPLPSDMAAAAALMVVAALARAIWFPFMFESAPMPTAMIHALGGAVPAMYLIGRVYPLMASFPFSRHMLCAWGMGGSLLSAAVAATVSRRDRQYRFLYSAQVGLMLAAVGLGGWGAAFSFLIPVVLTLCLLSCSFASGSPRRWAVAFGFVALSGLPLTPAFALEGGLLRAAWQGGWAYTALAALGIAATAFATGRAVRGGDDGKRPSDRASVLWAISLLTALIGLLNLASPPPAGRFLTPTLGDVVNVEGRWFVLAAVVAAAGAVTGYAVRLPPTWEAVGEWLADLLWMDGRVWDAVARGLCVVGRGAVMAEDWLAKRAKVMAASLRSAAR